MQSNGFAFLRFEKAKAHMVGAELVDALVIEMTSRGCGDPPDREPIDSYGIDRRGAAVLHRPWEKFDLEGLPFHVASEWVSHYLAELQSLPARRFASGQTYYKLHSGWSAAVLTVAQRDSLIAQLRARALAAAQRAEAFYTANPTPAEAMAEAARAGAAVIPPATDPQARLRRERGEA